MVENTDPDKFKFILDAYWLSFSGVNPVDYIKKLKDRIACVHLKDIRVSNGKPEIQLCEVGAGNINWDDVIEACKYANVPYAVVEQDTCQGRSGNHHHPVHFRHDSSGADSCHSSLCHGLDGSDSSSLNPSLPTFHESSSFLHQFWA